MTRCIPLTGLVLGCLLLAGCKGEQAAKGPPPPPEVLVSTPLVHPVTDYEVFTGRTEASNRVELRSRVTGYLEESPFLEGELVKKDDVLFHIDPKPYRAELARAEAGLVQAHARLRRLESDFERAQGLFVKQAIGREEYDRLRGDRDEAKASVGVADANVELARLNLSYTDVRAPFAGRISRRLVDPGNLVKADETILTVLVAEAPMYAYFDVDERTLLRQLLREGKLAFSLSDRVAVQIGLADEDGFPHAGVVNFVDNKLDTGTGSMWMRAQFTEPRRPIKAGMFIRVRFPLGQQYRAVLVAEQALGTDQGQKFVYVIGANNQVEYRPVKAGRLQEDGLRVIQEGLKPGERLVVSGLQRVRAGGTVTPKVIDMPVGPVVKAAPPVPGG
ncbi:MAG: efflux RND transporter periplasmic adaptor subunit [Planctomycetia bacterium]|nr:efflux RND transporter periplasmic adaptor subunit [Planctomycetia bacterium]